MTSREEFHPDVSRGIFTPNDLDWLCGKTVNKPRDHKSRSKARMALAMQDIGEIVDCEPEKVTQLKELGELFSDIQESENLSIEEAASNLIALAFIMCAHDLNYSNIIQQMSVHPADGGSPNNPDRPVRMGMFGTDDAIDEMLKFRRALSEGIKKGKSRFDNVPNRVIFKSNTPLLKEPTTERLDQGFDVEVWRDVVSSDMDAYSNTQDSDSSVIDYSDALERLQTEIRLQFAYRLTERQELANEDFMDQRIEF